MSKLLAILTAVVLAAPAAQASAHAPDVPPVAAAEEVTIFAAGGTQLTSGYFFPGTRFSDGNGGTTGAEPTVVPRGSNIRFINLDHYIVSGGAHKVTSFKKVRAKKSKRKVPLFSSEYVDGPGETMVKTSHVKPGTYLYYCPIHNGMLGAIKVE